jgi:hypothetical protein
MGVVEPPSDMLSEAEFHEDTGVYNHSFTVDVGSVTTLERFISFSVMPLAARG